MTPLIDDVLAPKSKDEVGEDMKRMHLYEFLGTFKTQKFSYIRKMDIGFKKKFYFFILHIFARKFNKWYWPFYVAWIINAIFVDWIFPSSDIFPRMWADSADDIGLIIIYALWIPLIISVVTMKRIMNHKHKQMRGMVNDIFRHQENLIRQHHEEQQQEQNTETN